jgi:hypothetical protein
MHPTVGHIPEQNAFFHKGIICLRGSWIAFAPNQDYHRTLRAFQSLPPIWVMSFKNIKLKIRIAGKNV